MVAGNEYIFENIDQAIEYVLACEKNDLSKDVQRLQPHTVISTPETLLAPASEKYIREVRPMSVDSLEYPFSAWFNNATDDKFVMTRLCSGRYSLKPNLRNRRYLFRGQSEFHNPCKPTLGRIPKQHRYTDELIRGQEMYLLMMSHPLVQLLDLGVELDGQLCQFEMNLFGLTQHYNNKTSFLDLTSDPQVAAFFAITEYDQDSDTYNPIIDKAHEPGVLYYYSLSINNDFRNKLSAIGLQVFPRSGRQKGFLYNMCLQENFNDVAQAHAFRFYHDGDIARRICEHFNNGETLFPDDILVQHWRSCCKDSKVISRRTVLMNKKFNSDMTLAQVEEEVGSLGFEIKDYRPTFTEEELDIYYDTIAQNGCWTDFCNQIYIPGDGQGRMMRDLLNLPNNPKYRWAFEKDSKHVTDYDKGFVMSKLKECLA